MADIYPLAAGALEPTGRPRPACPRLSALRSRRDRQACPGRALGRPAALPAARRRWRMRRVQGLPVAGRRYPSGLLRAGAGGSGETDPGRPGPRPGWLRGADRATGRAQGRVARARRGDERERRQRPVEKPRRALGRYRAAADQPPAQPPVADHQEPLRAAGLPFAGRGGESGMAGAGPARRAGRGPGGTVGASGGSPLTAQRLHGQGVREQRAQVVEG